MKIDVLTLFPEMFDALKSSIIGRALNNNLIEINCINIRDFSSNKHKKCDDYPFGGGAGMVMMPQPIYDALLSIDPEHTAHRIYLSPKGNILNNNVAKCLSLKEHIVLLCGHYEGVDQRIIDNYIDEEISIGDYILTGGELPSMVLIDVISRFIPKVLGSNESAYADSFEDGLLEFPQYTRPEIFNGNKVPEILLTGNHKLINDWRYLKKLELTKKYRPDLYTKLPQIEKDKIGE